MLLLAISWLLPFLWAVATAFKTETDAAGAATWIGESGPTTAASVPEDGDRHTKNTEAEQDRVGLVPLRDVDVDEGSLRATMPPLSWAVVEFDVARA